jgi:hypothetical protein
MCITSIYCHHCNFGGIIETPGAPLEAPAYRIFKHIGYNPFSGHLHYRCPACEIVLLVDPAQVQDKEFVMDIRGRLKNAKYPSATYAGVVYQ